MNKCAYTLSLLLYIIFFLSFATSSPIFWSSLLPTIRNETSVVFVHEQMQKKKRKIGNCYNKFSLHPFYLYIFFFFFCLSSLSWLHLLANKNISLWSHELLNWTELLSVVRLPSVSARECVDDGTWPSPNAIKFGCENNKRNSRISKHEMYCVHTPLAHSAQTERKRERVGETARRTHWFCWHSAVLFAFQIQSY